LGQLEQYNTVKLGRGGREVKGQSGQSGQYNLVRLGRGGREVKDNLNSLI
jgi:hypothetical protein